ncbi:MAG: hypothetical protein M3507_00410 [Actinomycetota bacterium]|nr:hypothetical protein [Actinomycetota bacterium]
MEPALLPESIRSARRGEYRILYETAGLLAAGLGGLVIGARRLVEDVPGQGENGPLVVAAAPVRRGQQGSAVRP